MGSLLRRPSRMVEPAAAAAGILSRHGSNLPPSQNAVQVCFIARTAHESRLLRGRYKKIFGPVGIGAPQMPSNQLNPKKQVKPGRGWGGWIRVFKIFSTARCEFKVGPTEGEEILLFIWYPTVSEYDTWPFYGGGRAQIKTHAQQVQKIWSPSAPSNKFSPASK